MNVWPWRKDRRELQKAREQLGEAERKSEEIQPLVHSLESIERVNHLGQRVHRALFGGRT